MTAVINSNRGHSKSTNRSFENAKSMVISVLVVVTVLVVTCLESPPPTFSSYPKEVRKLQSGPVEEGQVCCESNEFLGWDREQLPRKALEESEMCLAATEHF